MARGKDDPLKHALDFERPVRELDLQIAELNEKDAKAENGKGKNGRGRGTKAKASKGKQAKGKAAEAAPKGGKRLAKLIEKRDALLVEMQSSLTIWQRIQLSRHVERPVTMDYVDRLCTDVVELHGDRLYGEDRAIMTALAKLGGRKVLIVAHRKGRDTQARIACNWGCAHPEGYRKALRCMLLADRLGLPIVTLINTPGAYPGIGAEERGQASAIAWNILEMFRLRVPVVSVVIGEGGSGGALGIGVCDRLLILENAYYSVISPEGCASILWKDGARAEEAALALKLGSDTLVDLGVADERIAEFPGGAHRDKDAMAAIVGEALERHLGELCALPPEELARRRAAKYRGIGEFAGVATSR
jgi:acetyl-CoA carboxylase carboxyl transferase subunit alpha